MCKKGYLNKKPTNIIGGLLEVQEGFEPPCTGFADRRLTTHPSHHINPLILLRGFFYTSNLAFLSFLLFLVLLFAPLT